MNILGIDIGGSGIKAAIIHTENGELVSERYRIDTPNPATPETVSEAITQVVDYFNWQGPVGCTFPTIIKKGQCMHPGNLGKVWVGVHVDQLFQNTSGVPFYVSNDADLAGVAEMSLGAGKGKMGKVFVITIGTGIGSGMFFDGKLIPNLELGRIYHTNGKIVERHVADSARKREDLSIKKWAKRFDKFLHHLVTIHSPGLIILGGGISKKYDQFQKYLTIDVPIEVAHFRNNAGIIGAAMFAAINHSEDS